MKNGDYYRKFIITNIILLLFHMMVFIGSIMYMAAIATQMDSKILAVLMMFFVFIIEVGIHSIPNIILYINIKENNDNSLFVKTECIVCICTIIAYVVVFVGSNAM